MKWVISTWINRSTVQTVKLFFSPGADALPLWQQTKESCKVTPGHGQQMGTNWMYTAKRCWFFPHFSQHPVRTPESCRQDQVIRGGAEQTKTSCPGRFWRWSDSADVFCHGCPQTPALGSSTSQGIRDFRPHFTAKKCLLLNSHKLCLFLALKCKAIWHRHQKSTNFLRFVDHGIQFPSSLRILLPVQSPKHHY